VAGQPLSGSAELPPIAQEDVPHIALCIIYGQGHGMDDLLEGLLNVCVVLPEHHRLHSRDAMNDPSSSRHSRSYAVGSPEQPPASVRDNELLGHHSTAHLVFDGCLQGLGALANRQAQAHR